MKNIISVVLLAVATSSFFSPLATGADTNKDFTKRISEIIATCQTITPGSTRADLLKIFSEEGGFHTAVHQTFVFRDCPFIKVDVDFTLSGPKQDRPQKEPTDIVSKISQPYLAWSVID